MNGWDFKAWVQLHIVEKRKNLNTIPAGAQSFQHWGAVVGFKQGNNVLNQTGGNHLDNMYGMDSKKTGSLPKGECVDAPCQVSCAPLWREMGAGVPREGEQAAGLERDEGFPWQPLLAHRRRSSANSPGTIPTDPEA